MRQVRPAVLLALLARLVVRQGRDDGVVDRPVVADEVGVAAAQPHLQLLPGLPGGLGAQHVAHGIADRHQAANDLRRLQADPLPDLAGLDLHRDGLAAEDLAQATALPEMVAALLDGGAIRGAADAHGIGELPLVLVAREGIRVGGEDAGRQVRKGRVELHLQGTGFGVGPAGVGPARSINPTALTMRAKHHLGVRREILVHQHRAAPKVARRGRSIRIHAVQLGLLIGVVL